MMVKIDCLKRQLEAEIQKYARLNVDNMRLETLHVAKAFSYTILAFIC